MRQISTVREYRHLLRHESLVDDETLQIDEDRRHDIARNRRRHRWERDRRRLFTSPESSERESRRCFRGFRFPLSFVLASLFLSSFSFHSTSRRAVLQDLTHNVCQRIVLHHAIVNDETIRRGVGRNVVFAVEFQTNVHSGALDRLVLAGTIYHYERTAV